MLKKLTLFLFLFLTILFLPVSYGYNSETFEYLKVFEQYQLPHIVLKAETGKIIMANNAAIDFYGYPKEELLKLNVNDINTLSKKELLDKSKEALNHETNNFIFEHRLANGDIKKVEVFSYPIVVDDVKFLSSIIIDRTEKIAFENDNIQNQRIIIILASLLALTLFIFSIKLNQRKNKYKKLAHIDTLTKAYSRLYLDEAIQSIETSSKDNINFSVAQIDIDQFKNINDTYGHQTGDRVLKYFVKTTKEFIRNDDFILRFGGDEFLILLKHCSKEKAKDIIHRIQKNLNESKDFSFSIYFSFGIEEISSTNEIDNAIKRADQQMYTYKKENCYKKSS